MSRWFISFVGTALFAGLLWVFGAAAAQFRRFLDPARDHSAFMLVIWGGANFLLDVRRRRRDDALAKGVRQVRARGDGGIGGIT